MVHVFDATYDAAGAARAERAFYVRSVRELHPYLTFAPPVGYSVFVAACLALSASVWLVAFFAVLLSLSVLGPLFFYVARPLKAKRLALKYPVRRITLTPQSMQIAVGGQTADIAWGRIKHVWDEGEYLLLVVNKFMSVSIPKRSLPPGGGELIRASVHNAA
jgi:hypothetical protein